VAEEENYFVTVLKTNLWLGLFFAASKLVYDSLRGHFDGNVVEICKNHMDAKN